jgi:NADH-quinone oxidoreductase subunit N
MGEQILNDLSLFQPELILTITLLFAIVTDLMFHRTATVVVAVCMIGLIAAGVLVIGEANFHASIFSGMIAVDPFAFFFKLVIVVSALLVMVFSLQSRELNSRGRKLGEYYLLLIALTLGMMLMTGASNMLMMYLAMELSSLTSYILSGYTKEAPDSSEASLKYVIYGAVSSGLMIYGMSVIYGLTGSLDLYTINAALPRLISTPIINLRPES